MRLRCTRSITEAHQTDRTSNVNNVLRVFLNNLEVYWDRTVLSITIVSSYKHGGWRRSIVIVRSNFHIALKLSLFFPVVRWKVSCSSHIVYNFVNNCTLWTRLSFSIQAYVVSNYDHVFLLQINWLNLNMWRVLYTQRKMYSLSFLCLKTKKFPPLP